MSKALAIRELKLARAAIRGEATWWEKKGREDRGAFFRYVCFASAAEIITRRIKKLQTQNPRSGTP